MKLDMNYDAVLVVSFGGPESREDVIPFLENVLRGRNVPHERMLEVAQHYYHFGGKSPINQQARELVAALEAELARNGPQLPVFWGNRNWHPLLADTLREMKQQGIRRALAFVTSAYSSYSGCRQYREDIARAQHTVGAGVPEVDKLRAFFNHPGFIAATAERLQDALLELAAANQHILAPWTGKAPVPTPVHVVYTAHSIPVSMADSSDYVRQLEEVRGLVSARQGVNNHVLVYQSRSGAPGQAWLEPDVLDYLREVNQGKRAKAVVLAPIGFVSDHMEVLYDLDVEARQLCDSLGLPMTRAKTVGVHPKFVAMIRELILERIDPAKERVALGSLGARPDACAEECCPAPRRPGESGSNRGV
jgi:ferrochelatase